MMSVVCGSSTSKLIIDGIVAFGTIAVAILAIWGDWIRSKLAPAKLAIELHTPEGDPTTNADGLPLMFYHLKVVNKRRWLPATNCRVLLKGLSRRGPDNEFHDVPMAVPLQFVWAPAEVTPPVITLLREQVLDFGILAQGAIHFTPRLYSYANNFQGYVGPNEAVRFYLAIEATNFSSPLYQVFEVAWNGHWSHVPAVMKDYLTIQER